MLIDLEVWLNHFEYHATRLQPLPAGRAESLTAIERRRTGSSLATFQLGEQSAGRSLLRAANRFESRHGIAGLTRLIELFLAEEKHHAAILGEFLDQHGIPRKQRDWTDHAFRFLRKLAGFELHLTVLITAELIGKVYYRALESATRCRQLQALCRIMVADELAHVGFESELLRAIRSRRPWPARAGTNLAHRAFLGAVALVVWLTHRNVLRAAGYRLPSFIRACDAQYRFHLEPLSMRPQTA